MAGVTPNIRLNLPTYDQPGWDTLLAANWSVLDSLVARTLGLPGSYTGLYVPGASYVLNSVATDVTDSSLWQAGSGFTTLVTNTFAQERAANPSHWTNVTVSTTNAATSATLAAGSATSAGTSSTAAAASAITASTGATNASASAIAAANSAASTQSTFRNKLLNPQFTIIQMTAVGTPVAVVGGQTNYVNDGWIVQAVGAPSGSGTIQLVSDSMRTTMSDEFPTNYMQAQCITAPAANDYFALIQRLENNFIFAGKTVVFSFWAASSIAAQKICIEFTQFFGTGGSPSATVAGIGQQVFTLSTTLTKYITNPITIPTIIGKTLGTTANTDYLQMRIFLTAGATIGASTAGSIGTQAFTLSLVSPQLEIGSAASPFERRPYPIDLMLAQRFYETGSVALGSPGASIGGLAVTQSPYKVKKRIAPTTITLTNNSFTNVTSTTAPTGSPDNMQYNIIVTAAGAYLARNDWAADARL